MRGAGVWQKPGYEMSRMISVKRTTTLFTGSSCAKNFADQPHHGGQRRNCPVARGKRHHQIHAGRVHRTCVKHEGSIPHPAQLYYVWWLLREDLCWTHDRSWVQLLCGSIFPDRRLHNSAVCTDPNEGQTLGGQGWIGLNWIEDIIPRYVRNPDEDWKQSCGLMSTVTPKFSAEPDLSEFSAPKPPALRLCTMTSQGHLQLPDAVRKKWLSDPVRSNWPCLGIGFQNALLLCCSKWVLWTCFRSHDGFVLPYLRSIQDADWRTRLKNFDSVFPPVQDPEQAAVPNPTSGQENLDLGQTPAETPQEPIVGNAAPPSMTEEVFNQKFPEIACSVTLNMGQNVICHYADGKCFLTTATKFTLVGLDGANPKPLFLFGGGSWISDAKAELQPKNTGWLWGVGVKWDCTWQAKDYISKEANSNKSVEFRLESSDDWVSECSFSNMLGYCDCKFGHSQSQSLWKTYKIYI